MTRNLAQRPCFRAFCETLAFISGDFGPQDFCALRRLAAICLAVAINLVLLSCAPPGKATAGWKARPHKKAAGSRWNYWAGVYRVRADREVKLLESREIYC